MKPLHCFVLVVALACASFAQTSSKSNKPNKVAAETAKQAPKEPPAQAGPSCKLDSCRSFHELVSSRDKDLLHALDADAAYVCFRSDGDEFFVVQYGRPSPDGWTEDETRLPANYYEQAAERRPTVRFIQWDIAEVDWYSEGVLNNTVYDYGQWSSLGKRDINGNVVLVYSIPTYRTIQDQAAKPDSTTNEPEIYISDTQFGLNRSFDNRSGDTTQQDVSIQLSTGRYKETFSWKGASHREYIEKTGRCDMYSKGKSRK